MVNSMSIKEISNNPTLAGQVRLIEDIVYSAADGEAQKMSILAPQSSLRLNF